RTEESKFSRRSGYEIEDASYSVKKLSETALQSYQQRIEELRVIEGTGKGAQEDIVEWLVRCAENPATRWEGAFEIENTSPEDELHLRPRLTEKPESGGQKIVEEHALRDDSVVSGEDGTETESEDQGEEEPPGLVSLLSAEQKERLIGALLATETLTD